MSASWTGVFSWLMVLPLPACASAKLEKMVCCADLSQTSTESGKSRGCFYEVYQSKDELAGMLLFFLHPPEIAMSEEGLRSASITICGANFKLVLLWKIDSCGIRIRRLLSCFDLKCPTREKCVLFFFCKENSLLPRESQFPGSI